MQRVEVNVKRIVKEVAAEFNLSIESDKEEVLHLRKNRKKRSAGQRYVKCLEVIVDDALDFDMNWNSRLAKSRKTGDHSGACVRRGGKDLMKE